MTRTTIGRGLAMILAVFIASCASSPVHQASDSYRSDGSSSDVIRISELERLDPALPLLDAITVARPFFLRARGSTSMVSVDNAPPTDQSVLRLIPVSEVREIRLLRAISPNSPVAMQADGMLQHGNVILVLTHRGPRT